MPEQPPFLGRGWAFPPSFVHSASAEHGRGREPRQSQRGRVEMVEAEEDICQSLTILFHTALGERVMQPGYGCDLKEQVFEPMNAAVLTFIEDLLRTAIVYHEPRIETERLDVVPEQLEGRLHIDLTFVIRGTNSRFNFVYPYYLEQTGQAP